MFVKSYMSLAMLLVLATACRDADAATAPTRPDGLDVTVPSRIIALADTTSGGTVLSDPPAGYASWGFTQLDVTPDAGWNGQVAYGQAVVNYYATDATADVALHTSYGTTPGPSASGHEVRSSLLPVRGKFTAQATVTVAKDCGYIANVEADGAASFKVLSGKIALKWDEKATSGTTSAGQPKCSSSGGSVGGTGTGSGTGYAGGYGDQGYWTEICSVSETSYVDATGSHTTATTTCQTVFVSLT